MTTAVTDRAPDAVLAPIGFAGGGDAQGRLAKLQTEFGPILGAARVYVRHQGDAHFVSASPDDAILYQSLDPRSGEPRYAWADRGDGVMYGFLNHADPAA